MGTTDPTLGISKKIILQNFGQLTFFNLLFLLSEEKRSKT